MAPTSRTTALTVLVVAGLPGVPAGDGMAVNGKSSNDVSAGERAISALVGYFFGGLVVLPFDRLKVSMQASAQSGVGVSAVARLRAIVQQSGVRGLYQGGMAHFMIAPYTVLYYSTYDELLKLEGGNNPLAPLGAAILARTVETYVRMPLELIRTQMQAAEGSMSIATCARALRAQPFHLWFRGTVPTLLRDVPFSAIYWFSYEHAMRRTEIPSEWVPNGGVRTFAKSFLCGAGAGMVAGLLTTPTDVIKTVRQHQVDGGQSASYADIWRLMRQNPRLAFAGVGPRLLRIPAGMATMMAGLEVTKWAFDRRRHAASIDSGVAR